MKKNSEVEKGRNGKEPGVDIPLEGAIGEYGESIQTEAGRRKSQFKAAADAATESQPGQ